MARRKRAEPGAWGGNPLARADQQQQSMGKLYFARKKATGAAEKENGGDKGGVEVVAVCKKDLQMDKKDADVYTRGGQEQVN